jgi:ABC-type amino acid transport substrate-binding protein
MSTLAKSGAVVGSISNNYGKTELAVPVSSPITGIGGLKGKRVIAVTGSSNIQPFAALLAQTPNFLDTIYAVCSCDRLAPIRPSATPR